MKGAKSLTNLRKYWIWSVLDFQLVLFSVGFHQAYIFKRPTSILKVTKRCVTSSVDYT